MKRILIVSILLLFVFSLTAVSAQDNTTCGNDKIIGDIEKQDLNVSIEVPEELAKYSPSNDTNYFNISGIPENIGDYDIYIDDEYYSNGSNKSPIGFEIDVSKYSLGPHIIKANFTGNNQYNAFSINKTFNIRNFEIIIPDEFTIAYVNEIEAYLPGDATGTFEVYINDKLIGKWNRYYTVQYDSYLSFDPVGMYLRLGANIVEWKYSGDNKYPGESKKKTVNGNYSNIWSYEYLIYGDISPAYIHLFPLKNITVEINGTIYPTYRSEEYVELVGFYYDKLNPGNYIATIRGIGNDEFPSITIQQNITILPEIKPAYEIIKYNNNETYSLYIPEDANGNLNIYVNEKLFKTTPAKGDTSISLNGLKVGAWEITARYTGNDYTVYENKKNITVIPKLIHNMEIDYWANEICYIEFEPEANYNVTYSFENGQKGVIKLVNGKGNFSLSKIDSNFFEIEYKNSDYENQIFEHVIVNGIPPKFTGAKDITMFYADGTSYTLKLWIDNYHPAGRYEGVTVKIGNTEYERYTNENGVITLKLGQAPGKYTITSTYKNAKITTKLVVKHILTLNTVKVKKSAKKLVLTATLKNKKPIKNKQITFKFNKKIYKAKTNSKGIAKVTIKKSVLKKLKVGKKLTYQATYLKDTVKKTVRVQK
ncbi:hypothetical protein [uncultured Methanobrevibacter sp.]|uniref:hypothetical protein n=1 Tax=uncultured Methanobrevibacter sp. TaxID=253161 RepID=UPI002602128C|nr:hypothetical protein [uncultured Methanobrevibacter sp.]